MTWNLPHRIELAYQRAIKQLFHDILAFPKDFSVEEIINRLKTFDVSSFVDVVVSRMVTQVRIANARSWQAAAQKSSQGRKVYLAIQREMRGPVGDLMRGITSENARLIRSIPGEVREHIDTMIGEMQRQGARPETIAKEVRKQVPHLLRWKATLIARTESSKAATALTRARADDLGLRWYEWLTSEDQRVRQSHRKMDTVLVNWDDPPSPEALVHEKSTLGSYHAGDAPNCRCVPAPIIDTADVVWPHKVYRRGRIERLTLAKFRQIA